MVKLADTLAPMSDFPVAKAEHITVKIKDKEQNLETTLNSMSGGYTVEELPEASAELFGKVYQYIGETTDTLTKGYFYVCTTDENAEYIWKQTEVQKPGLPDPEAKDKVLVSTENEETSELEWSQVDKGTIDGSAYVNLDVGSDLNTLITHGRYRTTTKRVDRIENVPVQVAGMLTVRLTGSVIYQTYNSIDNKMYTRTSEDAGENWSDWKDVSEGGDEPFKGTHDDWDALTDEQKAMFETVIFTDDYGEGVIDDTKPNSTVTTLSAKKINDSLVDIEDELEGKFVSEYINFIPIGETRDFDLSKYLFVDARMVYPSNLHSSAVGMIYPLVKTRIRVFINETFSGYVEFDASSSADLKKVAVTNNSTHQVNIMGVMMK